MSIATTTTSAAVAPITGTAKLSVRNLNFYYGKFHALKNINLDIPEHKVTAFIGPSGCGKSTLLRTFNRMYELYPEQRATGQILLDGEDLLTSKQDVALIRAKVGMVFQKPTPFPMSIYDNIAFGVKLFESLDATDMDERVEWALRKAALWGEVKDKLHPRDSRRSGASQQRPVLRRALLRFIVFLFPAAPAPAGGFSCPRPRRIPSGLRLRRSPDGTAR